MRRADPASRVGMLRVRRELCSLRRYRPKTKTELTTQSTRIKNSGPHNIHLWKVAGLLAAVESGAIDWS